MKMSTTNDKTFIGAKTKNNIHISKKEFAEGNFEKLLKDKFERSKIRRNKDSQVRDPANTIPISINIYNDLEIGPCMEAEEEIRDGLFGLVFKKIKEKVKKIGIKRFLCHSSEKVDLEGEDFIRSEKPKKLRSTITYKGKDKILEGLPPEFFTTYFVKIAKLRRHSSSISISDKFCLASILVDYKRERFFRNSNSDKRWLECFIKQYSHVGFSLPKVYIRNGDYIESDKRRGAKYDARCKRLEESMYNLNVDMQGQENKLTKGMKPVNVVKRIFRDSDKPAEYDTFWAKVKLIEQNTSKDSDLDRYQTFPSDWVEHNNDFCRENLAKKGFVYVGNEPCGHADQIMCVYCGVKLYDFSVSDNLDLLHIRSNKLCPSLFNNRDILRNSDYRLSTFDTWDCSFVSKYDLVEANFVYTGIKDKVKCIYCDGSIYNWEQGDNPVEEHKRLFPHCMASEYNDMVDKEGPFDFFKKVGNAAESISGNVDEFREEAIKNMDSCTQSIQSINESIAAALTKFSETCEMVGEIVDKFDLYMDALKAAFIVLYDYFSGSSKTNFMFHMALLPTKFQRVVISKFLSLFPRLEVQETVDVNVNSNEVEMQGLPSIIKNNVVVELIQVLFSLVGIVDVPSNMVRDVTNKLRLLENSSVRSLGIKILEILVDNVLPIWVKQPILDYVPFLDKDKLCVKDIEDFTVQYYNLEKKHPNWEVEMKTSLVLVNECKRLKKVAEKIFDKYPIIKIKNENLYYVNVNAAYDKLRKALTELPPYMNSDKDRVKPWMFYVHGSPGLGKSTTVMNIAKYAAAKVLGFSEAGKKLGQYVFERDINTAFWEGYYDHPIVIYNDVFQTKDSDTVVRTINELTQVVDDAVFPVPMAFSRKGEVFMNSSVVIVNSQSNICTADTVVTQCESEGRHLSRRMDYAIHFDLNEKYKIKGSNKPDWNAVKNSDSEKLADGIPCDLCYIRKYVDVKNSTFGQSFSDLRDFVKDIIESLNDYKVKCSESRNRYFDMMNIVDEVYNDNFYDGIGNLGLEDMFYDAIDDNRDDTSLKQITLQGADIGVSKIDNSNEEAMVFEDIELPLNIILDESVENESSDEENDNYEENIDVDEVVLEGSCPVHKVNLLPNGVCFYCEDEKVNPKNKNLTHVCRVCGEGYGGTNYGLNFLCFGCISGLGVKTLGQRLLRGFYIHFSKVVDVVEKFLEKHKHLLLLIGILGSILFACKYFFSNSHVASETHEFGASRIKRKIIPQSGEFKSRYKVRRELAQKIVLKQGNIHSAVESTVSMVANLCVDVYEKGNLEGERTVINLVGVIGQSYIVTRHQWDALCKLDSAEHDIEITMIYGKNMDNQQDMLNIFDIKDYPKQEICSELYVVKIPLSTNNRDNLKKFIREEGIQQVMMSKISRICRTYTNHGVVVVKSDFSHAKFENLTIDGNTVNNLVAANNIHTEKGDCGSIYVTEDNSVEGCIVSVHVGRNPRVGAVSEIVTREMLEEAVIKLKDYSCSPKIQDEKLTDFGVGLQGSCDEIDIIGTSENYCRLPSKNKVVRTNLANAIEERIGPELERPARLAPFVKDGDIISPLIKAQNKILAPKHRKELCNVDIIEAREDLYRQYNNGVKCQHDYPKQVRKVLGIEESIGKVMELKPMDLKTSIGYPYVAEKIKKTDIVTNDKLNDSEECKLFLSRLNKRLEYCKKGIVSETLFTDNLKDETRPNAKVDEGVTRIFHTAPFDLQVLIRMYFGVLLSYLQNCSSESEIMIGINPDSVDWGEIRHRLVTFGKKNCFAGDLSAFDSSLSSNLIMSFADLANDWYDDGEENKIVRITLIRTLCNRYHLVENILHYRGRGNPSGNALTAPLNCYCLQVLYRICFKHLTKLKIRDFIKFVRLIVYGDDNAGCVSDEVREDFNFKNVCDWFTNHGMKMTMADKESDVVEFIHINDVTFLKRFFKVDIDGRVLAPFDKQDLWNPLRYSTVNPSDSDQLSNIAHQVQRFHFHEGRQAFDRCTKNIERIFSDSGISLNYDMLKTYDETYSDMYIDCVKFF